MKFNEKLIELRKKSGLSQEELGYKLNVTRQTVSKWELGQTTPEMDKLTELSKIFNVTADDLLNDSEIPANNNIIIDDQPIQGSSVKNSKNTALIVGIIIIVLIIGASIILLPFAIFNKAANNIFGNSDKIFDKAFSTFDKVFDTALDAQEDMLDNVNVYSETTKDFINNTTNELYISKFNSVFEINVGTRYGSSIKNLLEDVITSNSTNDRKITVKYMNIETQDKDEIRNLKTNIKDSSSYEVALDYGEDKYVTTVIIKSVVTQFDISRFNSSLELFSGSNIGGSAHSVLDKIITSNKTNERKITVVYNSKETQNEDEIRNFKQDIDTFDNVEIIYDYDADGFIYKATIKKV